MVLFLATPAMPLHQSKGDANLISWYPVECLFNKCLKNRDKSRKIRDILHQNFNPMEEKIAGLSRLHSQALVKGAKSLNDVVFLEDVILSMRIGCSRRERSERQPVRLNVYMRYDCRSAGCSDNLKDALNYVKAYRSLEEIAISQEFVLLERFCELAAAALIDLGAESVRIQASKVRCPIPGLQGRVGVEIERSKDDLGK